MKRQIHVTYASNIGTRYRNEDNFLLPKRRIRKLKKDEYVGKDTFTLKENEPLQFAVADGMGGQGAGDAASAAALSALRKSNADPPEERKRFVNAQVLRLQKRLKEHCGTTLVYAELRTDGRSVIAYILAAGDSPCFRICNGQVRKITHDDNLYRQLKDANDLPENDEEIARAKAALLNYFGKPTVETQKYKLFLEPGDTLVLSSDGILLETGDEPFFLTADNPAAELVRSSMRENQYTTGAADNATAIVIRLEEMTK